MILILVRRVASAATNPNYIQSGQSYIAIDTSGSGPDVQVVLPYQGVETSRVIILKDEAENASGRNVQLWCGTAGLAAAGTIDGVARPSSDPLRINTNGGAACVIAGPSTTDGPPYNVALGGGREYAHWYVFPLGGLV